MEVEQDVSPLPKTKSSSLLDIEKIELEKLEVLAEKPEVVKSLIDLKKTSHQLKMEALMQYTKVLVSSACLGFGIFFSYVKNQESGLLIGGGLAGLGLSTNVLAPGSLREKNERS